MPISNDAFRDALCHFPSGVTIVTIRAEDRVHGLTVSAFSSVSPEPPLILVSIDHRHYAHKLLEQPGATFAVNILQADQAEPRANQTAKAATTKVFTHRGAATGMSNDPKSAGQRRPIEGTGAMKLSTSKYSRLTLMLLLMGALAILTGCGSPDWRGTPYDPPRPAAEITGVNWDNTAFRLSDLRGKIALLFFGYTYCPDVCPTTMAEMRKLMEQLGAQADKVAVVFISVDPERDTPARLAEYVPFFDRRFYGIQVAPDALGQVKRDYGVYAEKRPYVGVDGVETYTVDHTARVFLVDQAGALRLSFPYGTPVDDIRSDISRLLR